MRCANAAAANTERGVLFAWIPKAIQTGRRAGSRSCEGARRYRRNSIEGRSSSIKRAPTPRRCRSEECLLHALSTWQYQRLATSHVGESPDSFFAWTSETASHRQTPSQRLLMRLPLPDLAKHRWLRSRKVQASSRSGIVVERLVAADCSLSSRAFRA